LLVFGTTTSKKGKRIINKVKRKKSRIHLERTEKPKKRERDLSQIE